MIPSYEKRQISPDWRQRLAPPTVWEFQNYSGWKSSILYLLNDVIDEDVRAKFLDEPPEYIVGDNLDWLDGIIEAVHGCKSDIGELLVNRLRTHYRAFRATHGTRTADLASFYEKGLLPLDPNRIHDELRSRFLNGRFRDVGEAQLEAAMEDMGDVDGGGREGRLYFEANQDFLIQFCAHYMIHGSEYLHCLAIRLGNPDRFRAELRKEGKPVVFVCDVPMAFISSRSLRDFAGTTLEYIFKDFFFDGDFEPEPYQGAGFSILQPLCPQAIVGHFFPAKMRDPHRGGIVTDGFS
ncbi:hypothetical protein [Roseovarius ramblicola]|uniref:Uncharacterized protein n=1 Tax=Roseovarius ramblicola TaxID=2022336 RepID=A0ABV5HY10_9RHOB